MQNTALYSTSVTALLLLLLLLSHYTHFDFTDRYLIPPPRSPFINTQTAALLPWRQRQYFLRNCYILGENDLAIPFSCHAVIISAVETA